MTDILERMKELARKENSRAKEFWDRPGPSNGGGKQIVTYHRDQQILAMLHKGMSQRQIARIMHVHQSTVRRIAVKERQDADQR